MLLLKPLLGNSEVEKALAVWDMQYTPDSVGADICEAWYRALQCSIWCQE